MAEEQEQTANTVGKNLEDIFLEGWTIYDELENTNLAFNSTEFQAKVKKCMELFEDSTRIVSLVGMFSSNEQLDEVATEYLQFILLPFFLGQLSTKLSNVHRGKVLEIAEVYYRDFLERCEAYEIIKSDEEKSSTVQLASTAQPQTDIAKLMQMGTQRRDKIAEFRKKKELESEISQMKEALKNPNVDEDIKRQFFLKFINKSIIESHDELESLALEKQLVEMRETALKNEHKNPQKKVTRSTVEPLKPIIITRDAAQKAVFGLGYPSLPVMSVRDFYEQRVAEGIFPNAAQVVEMNKRLLEQQDEDLADEKEEMEKIQKEILVENDDPEYLANRRAMDEYKDNVRRGDGNRHNRS